MTDSGHYNLRTRHAMVIFSHALPGQLVPSRTPVLRKGPQGTPRMANGTMSWLSQVGFCVRPLLSTFVSRGYRGVSVPA